MIQRLHHVQITIPSDATDQARAFYCELLGLREIPKPESLQARGGFWLELSGQELHVSLEDGVHRHTTKAHLAYQVDDLEFWRSRLSDAGCQILEGVPIPGFDRLETRDPFGNRLEMIQPKTEGSSMVGPSLEGN
jgi:catechol 2,3-dioxygenase-like lactoylglutathione lyase family enzyme